MANPRFVEGEVRIIGHRWSPRVHTLKTFFARSRVPYQWLDIDRDDEAHAVAERAVPGIKQFPVVLFPDGSFLVDGEAPYKGNDHYERLLRSNFIATPASVLYRRSTFKKVGLFDETLSPAADYDMYLRISREFPLCAHDETVAEYRQHGLNMSCNSGLMLDSVLKALEKQKSHAARGNRHVNNTLRSDYCENNKEEDDYPFVPGRTVKNQPP